MTERHHAHKALHPMYLGPGVISLHPYLPRQCGLEMTYMRHSCAALWCHTLADLQRAFEKLPDLTLFFRGVILGDVIYHVLAPVWSATQQ